MKWILFMTVVGLTSPVSDVPPFDTESGCLMAKHSIEMKVGPVVSKAMNLSCLTIGQAIVPSPLSCLREHELAHAGGWGPDHPGAIYTKRCGHLPMPPHRFSLKGVRPVIHSVPRDSIMGYCGYAQACTIGIGSNTPVIYLPTQ